MKKMSQCILFLFFMFWLFNRCNLRTETKNLIEKKDSSNKFKLAFKEADSLNKLVSVSQLFYETNNINFTDEGSFWLLYFKPKKVFFDFNLSCGYWFPTSMVDGKLIFLWASNMNCNFDRGLSKTFEGIKSPQIGKPFGIITLSSDSTLHIEYLYKEWVTKINKESKKNN